MFKAIWLEAEFKPHFICIIPPARRIGNAKHKKAVRLNGFYCIFYCTMNAFGSLLPFSLLVEVVGELITRP